MWDNSNEVIDNFFSRLAYATQLLPVSNIILANDAWSYDA